jgi:hypothetical protein
VHCIFCNGCANSSHGPGGTCKKTGRGGNAVHMDESSLSILRRPHGFVRQSGSEAISTVKELPNDFTA